ncbi:MAG: TatD family hydrolase [Atopobiaceae bacterium]|nr:TatD family hydrolase [Atopobiaceae bacterium]
MAQGFDPSAFIAEDGYLFHAKKGAEVELPEASAPITDTHGHLVTLRHMPAHVALVRAALAGVRFMVTLADPVEDVEDVDAFERWLDEELGAARSALASLHELGIDVPVLPGYEEIPQLTESLRFLAGTHPYGSETLRGSDDARTRLKRLLAHPLCVGVGEFGLDYGPYNRLAPEVQMEAFRCQLRIAHELGRPVELHLRDKDGDEEFLAHRDAALILEQEGVPEAGCDLHCFTVGPDVMEPFVEMGCHVAFGGAVTFNRSDDVRAAAAACPADRILSETDCPYMTPVPLRGQRCEPAMVVFSAACIADTREAAGVSTRDQVYRDLWENAHSFFGI